MEANKPRDKRKRKQTQNESKSKRKMVSLIPLVVFANREMEANKLKAFLCRVGSTREDWLKLKLKVHVVAMLWKRRLGI